MALKMQKFCRITLYIQQRDAKLADVIDKLCLAGKTFFPQHYENGVTFLYPDKNYQKIIFKQAVDNPEEAHKMIRALIISGYKPTPADFNNGQVKNRLNQVVEIKGVAGDTVTFENGKAVIDKAFRALPRDGSVRLAVYNLTGTIKTDGTTAAKESTPPAVEGGYYYESGSFKRRIFMQRLENDYMHKYFEVDVDKYGNTTPVEKLTNPYLEKLSSLLTHLEQEITDEQANAELVYKKVLYFLDFGVQASMYILLEPYRENPSIIPDEVLNRWKNLGYPKIPNALDVFKKHLDAIEPMDKHAACFDNINTIRTAILDNSTIFTMPKDIENAYKTHLDEYKTDPVLKMQQDELRFVVQTLFDDLEFIRQTDVKHNIVHRADIRSIFKSIQASHNLNKSNTNQLLIISPSKPKDSSMPKAFYYNATVPFVRSSAFLYHSVPPSDGGKFEEAGADHPMHRGKISLFTRRWAHAKEHYKNRTMSAHSILLQVRGLLASDNGKNVKEQLRALLE